MNPCLRPACVPAWMPDPAAPLVFLAPPCARAVWRLVPRWTGDFIVRGGGDESVIQRETRLVRLLVNKFAAHPVPRRQIADRRRSRQRLNSQVLALTLGQPCGGANTLIHLAPQLKSQGVVISPSNVNPAPDVTRL